MIKFNKVLTLSIATLTVSTLLLLTGIVYSYPLKDSLRVPVGQKSTYGHLIRAMHDESGKGERKSVDVARAEKGIVEPEYLEGTFRIIDRIIPIHTKLGQLFENVIKKAYRSGNIRYYVNLDSVGGVQMSPEGAPKVGLAIELKKALRKTTQALGFDDEVIYDYLAFHLVRMSVQTRLNELLRNDVDRTRTKTGEEFVGFVADNLLVQQLSIDRLDRLARFEEFLERDTVVVSSGLACSIGIRNHIKIKQNPELQKRFQHPYMPKVPEYYISSIFPTKVFDKEFNADWAIMACHSLGLVEVMAFHRDLLEALKELPKDRPIKIADLGTGFGSYLVELGLWLKDHGFEIDDLLGVDKIAEKAPKWNELCNAYPQLPLRFEPTEVKNLETDEHFNIVAINAPYSNENFIEMLPKALELLSRGGYLWVRFTASQARGASISGHAADGLIRLLDERFPNNWRGVTVDLPEDFLAGLVDFVPDAASSYPKGRLCLVYVLSSEQLIQEEIRKRTEVDQRL